VGVEIEHATVSLLVLMEYGGRSAGFSNILSEQISRASQEILDVLMREDKVALWIYGDKTKQQADFSKGQDILSGSFYTLESPGISETNLYDAVIAGLERMRPVTGRKAILLISSGIDTFSKASLEMRSKPAALPRRRFMQSTWALAWAKLAVFTASAV
jgi:hypothetical protein